MLYLLRRFVEHAGEHGTRAVVLLIPEIHEWKDGRLPPSYGDFVEQVLAPERLDLTIVDVAAADFDARRFSVAPFSGHASAYGNRVIASDLHNPDFVKYAESFGAEAERARYPKELRAALKRAFKRRDGPTLIEVPVGPMPSPWEFIHMPPIRGSV